jgi:iron complex outermembrane receptor protein
LNQRTIYNQDEESWAGYVNAGYTWGRLDIDAGVRVDYTTKDFHRVKKDPVSLAAPIGFSDHYDEWTLAPTFGLNFRVNERLDLFARTAWGFKPGGFTAFTDDPTLARYDRETVWSTEAGIRVRAFDGKLRSQLTGYVQDIDNYQVERAFSFTDYLVVNAGEARANGLELELAWEILTGLTFSGSIGYNQTQLRDYRDPFTDEDLGGNEAPYVPNFTALAALEDQHPSGVRAKVDYVVVGDTQFTDTNAERYRQSAYGVLNARVGYEREHFGVYVFARNLTDEKFFTNKSSDIDAGVIGEPRIFGVMGLVKF